MEEYPRTRMSSTTPSKMTTPITEKTLTITVPVRTYYRSEVDYDLFKHEYMPDKNPEENDEDYEKRCVATWERLLKLSKKGKFTFDEIDEGDHNFNHDHDALECYGEADDQMRELCLKVAHDQEMDNSKLKFIGKYMALGLSYDQAHEKATKIQRDCGALVDAQVAVATGTAPKVAPKRLVVGFTPYGEPIFEGKPTY